MENAVKLENITKKFSSTKFSLIDISFEIKKGSLTIVGGANGSGKSVLMMLISGLMKPTEGKLTVSSKPGLVFQDAATQILGDTPREDVSVGPKNLRFCKKDIPALVEDSLKSVRLLEKADIPAEYLSGGEKRRLAVASILAMKRDIIIFDEPYANLDYPAVCDVNRLLEQLKSEGKTVILLTHELEKCLALADHFLILQKGSLVFDGSPEEAVKIPLEQWAIRNPLTKYENVKDLIWK
ncbi:energy-coupling factor ABC transporter ATP-binding protein [Treponema sp.]|uniref:energy-coupling factor ABC transporter ATP-binding protein n=1 Tax=Treponema sp. TaxID=166 RepID=UPI00388E0CB5